MGLKQVQNSIGGKAVTLCVRLGQEPSAMSFLVKTSLPQVTGTEAEAGVHVQGNGRAEISACPGTLMALQALLVGGLAWSEGGATGSPTFSFLCLGTQHAGAVETITVSHQTDPLQTEFYKFSLLEGKRCDKRGFNFHSH